MRKVVKKTNLEEGPLNYNNLFFEFTCSYCGKLVTLPADTDTEHYAYQFRTDKGTERYCSYYCLNQAKAKYLHKRKYKKLSDVLWLEWYDKVGGKR